MAPQIKASLSPSQIAIQIKEQKRQWAGRAHPPCSEVRISRIAVALAREAFEEYTETMGKMGSGYANTLEGCITQDQFICGKFIEELREILKTAPTLSS